MIVDRLEAFFAGGRFVTGLAVGLVVADVGALLAARRGRPASARPVAAVAIALGAGLWMYACTPDTELARSLCGLVVGGGSVAVAVGLPWRRCTIAVTVALAYVALADGSACDSAVIGGLGIAAAHVVAQVGLEIGRRRPVVVVAGAVAASAVCSRIAGLGEGRLRPLVIACTAVAALAALMALTWPHARPARSDH